MIGDWLLIATTFVVLCAIWGFFDYVADLFESHRQAAKSMTARNRQLQKGKGSSS